MNSHRKTKIGSYKASEVGTFITDFSTGDWVGSKSCNQLLGIGENYPHTKAGWISLMSPETQSDTDLMMMSYLKTGGFFTHISKIINQESGITQYITVAVKSHFDQKLGKITHINGIFHDITQSVLDQQNIKFIMSNSQFQTAKFNKGHSIYYTL